MADGGIYDQIGGGFHRYSVDARWLVPHFEKMLYDNAELPRLYLELFQATGDPAHRRVVEETLDYLLREMRHADGGFYSATDADSEGEEGKFFVWTPAEVAAVVDPADVDLVCRYWDVTDEGNFEGTSIAHVTLTMDQVAKLFRRSPEDAASGHRDGAGAPVRGAQPSRAARLRRQDPHQLERTPHRHAGGSRTGPRRVTLPGRRGRGGATSCGIRCGATAGCCTAGPRDGRSRTRSSTTMHSWRRRSSTCTRPPATAVISPAPASSSTRSTPASTTTRVAATSTRSHDGGGAHRAHEVRLRRLDPVGQRGGGRRRCCGCMRSRARSACAPVPRRSSGSIRAPRRRTPSATRRGWKRSSAGRRAPPRS